MSIVTPRRAISLIAILAVAYGGCAAGTRPPAVRPPAAAEVVPPSSQALPSGPSQPEPAAPPRGSVKSLLVSPIAEEPQVARELISFSVKNVEIKDVLLGLSRLSKANIVFEPDIAGKVSVELKDVTIDEALKDLLSPMGLEATRDGRTIHIARQKMQTRIFTLNYVPTRRKGESQVAASSGGGTATAGTPAAGAAPTAGAAPAAGGQNAGFSRVQGEDLTDLWAEVRTTVERLLSPQGKYSINPMPGIVVVTDFPSQLDRIAKYFEAVEASVRRQVLIQAEVLEIKLTEDFEYGIDFSLSERARPGGRQRDTIVPGQPFIRQLLNPRTGIFNVGLADATITALLNLLQAEGKVRVLSRPSVSTLNNQKAIIKVATDDVFFETDTTITAQGVAQTNVRSSTVTIGVVLSVTPQISSDGYIVMDIHPAVTDSTATRTFQSGQVTASRPVVDVRETNTVLRVKDGESILIAGLVKTKSDKQVRRVPFLSDIPLLGYLFRQVDESSQNTELVIKITPRILPPGTS